MNRTLIRDLPNAVGTEVEVRGWVSRIRDQKAVQFVLVRDETGVCQTVKVRGDDELTALISTLTAESVVHAQGTVVEAPRVKLAGVEIQLTSIAVISAALPQLPITEETGLDQRLDWRFLDLRRPKNRLIFEVQTTLEAALREFWLSRDFIEIHSPKFMETASETGAELFRVEYFGRDAYLAQSPQFYKQMAIASGFGNVFEIGPVFRANPSFTARHDTEFTMIDVELGWIDSHEDVMALEENMLAHMLSVLRDQHGGAILKEFGRHVIVPQMPFPRVTLEEALRISAASGHTVERQTGDLDPEGERRVAAWAIEHHGHEFVFVTNYPSAVRPFYHMRPEGRQDLTNSYDLLWRGLEITTGAQREHRHDRLLAQAIEKELSPEHLKHYLGFFEYGCPPHGGFAIGLTRLLMILLDVSNVREVTYLYRGPNRLAP